MRFTIIAVGQIKNTVNEALFQEYYERLKERVTVKEVMPCPHLPVAQRKEKETQALLKGVPTASHIIALDEKGQTLTTQQFASFLEQKSLYELPHFCFLLGGADGLDHTILPPQTMLLSLGKMTWPHLLARALLMEQLYRASQVIKGHPYHRI